MISRSRPFAALLACLLCASSGCGYLVDRGADFLDQYRIAVGAGSVGGVRGRARGRVDSGLMCGIKPHAAALGWKYGTPLYFHEADGRIYADQAEIFRATSITDLDYAHGRYASARTSFALLPGVFTWTDASPLDYSWEVPDEGLDYEDSHWLWSAETFRDNRWAQIHAFDVELEVGLFVYVDAGWSPGELLDFLLGLVTIDIAGDDGRFGEPRR